MPEFLKPVSADHPDAVTLLGVRHDGTEEAIGTVRMPPKMKAREIVRSYFGEPNDGEGSDASMAMAAMEELIKWMQEPTGEVPRSDSAQHPEASEAAGAFAQPRFPAGTRRELDMAMLIRMLCASTASASTRERAMSYLRRHGLQGSPLRAGPAAPDWEGQRPLFEQRWRERQGSDFREHDLLRDAADPGEYACAGTCFAWIGWRLAGGADELGPTPAMAAKEPCQCAACVPLLQSMRMILCLECGNKRCPHATDHRLACTGSNETGQAGSSYGKLLVAGPVGFTEPERLELIAGYLDGCAKDREAPDPLALLPGAAGICRQVAQSLLSTGGNHG